MVILNDFNTSVEKALSEIDEHWKEHEGLILCGTHSPKNWEEIIEKIAEARKNDRPFLGICAGMQLAVIDYARNEHKIKDATSEEFGEKGTFVVYKLPELRVGMHEAEFRKEKSMESFWHNYASSLDVNTIGSWHTEHSESNKIMDVLEVLGNTFHVGVQFHPEYQSSKEKPHKILVAFLQACKQYKK